jgi:signal transduction histidine kinase
MFKEILSNVASHSQASAVQISIAWVAGRWHLVIKDNGIGFDAASIRPGNGLANLKRRAEVLHGVLKINSCPGQGTTVSFIVRHL